MNAEQTAKLEELREDLWKFYESSGRHDLPWRQPKSNGEFDPYAILVSELMLQQTQVPRVIPKFNSFLKQFPTFESLASASLADVLRAWSGLGYNRRAKFLWQTARIVAADFAGKLPGTREALVKLPGIGPNTAGAILAYAFDQPASFVETNVRTVFIHHFFANEEHVSDKAILEVLAAMLSGEPDARTFYWALMDYGSHLKQTVGNAARASAGHVKQSAFAGSKRQVRGQVLRALALDPQSAEELAHEISDERLSAVLADLLAEGMIAQTNDAYRLP